MVSGKKKNYFIDKEERIVATIDKNLSSITMFYSYRQHSRNIWNHHGKVAIIFARDFNVNEKCCDILCIEGLCGACNDFELYEDYYLGTTNNEEMRNLLEKEISLQNQFETKPYQEKITILETLKGAKFTGANIKGIQLFEDSEKYALGNCGFLFSKNGIAEFDICGVIKIENMVVNQQDNGYDINVINIKGTKENTNYEEIYNFYRNENDWHYKDGFNTSGSYETRAYTERRKYSTVDKEAIHIDESTLKMILLDEIYEKKSKSLNSKRLCMINTLSQLLHNKKVAEEYVATHYDFAIRNCELKRQRVKKESSYL